MPRHHDLVLIRHHPHTPQHVVRQVTSHARRCLARIVILRRQPSVSIVNIQRPIAARSLLLRPLPFRIENPRVILRRRPRVHRVLHVAFGVIRHCHRRRHPARAQTRDHPARLIPDQRRHQMIVRRIKRIRRPIIVRRRQRAGGHPRIRTHRLIPKLVIAVSPFVIGIRHRAQPVQIVVGELVIKKRHAAPRHSLSKALLLRHHVLVRGESIVDEKHPFAAIVVLRRPHLLRLQQLAERLPDI